MVIELNYYITTLGDVQMKLYAVRKGNQTGIFESWAECQDATKGFSGAEFKSFKTREEAEAYLQDRDLWAEQVAEDNKLGFLVAFTDGSYEENLKRYSYGVVLICPDGHTENICGYGSNEKYLDSNNIIGEIFGVINALDWAISNGYEKIKIYHDYEGLSKWISGEWSANAPASQMYIKVYQSKYEGLIEVNFEKVPGHSNVSYNEMADGLAKSALVDRKKLAIEGENWFSIPFFDNSDFEAISEIVSEADPAIGCKTKDLSDKNIFKFTRFNESVTVTLFKSGNHKLLVQGKNGYLLQVIATTIVELDDNCKVEQILGSAYRTKIQNEIVDGVYKPLENGFSSDYPENIKRLIKQAIINLSYYVEAEDYSQYAFPALRALEGHIKYLIKSAGGAVNQCFNGFNRASRTDPYFYTASLSDPSKKPLIEVCYNYYKSQRDTAFHFGDIMGSTDSTRIINKKEDADEIINECLRLINENI